MTVYQQILESSVPVDSQFAALSGKELLHFKLSFRVSPSHKRFGSVQNYTYEVGSMAQILKHENQLIIADNTFRALSWLNDELVDKSVIWLTPREEETKERYWLDRFISDESMLQSSPHEIVVIGGGILLNAGAYIAEQLGSDLAYIPTTVLAMSDGSIGGKVRANEIKNGIYHKHAYKSFYEPNRILIDPRFLQSLPDKQIAIGLGEVIKHGVYQSRALLEYLVSNDFYPQTDKDSLLKAVLWAAALKEVCLNIDPDETTDGSHVIMRGGHEASDKIEELSHFQIPHGTAVAIAVYEEMSQKSSELMPLLDACYRKFSIPTKNS